MPLRGARGSPPTNVHNFPFSIFNFTFATTPAGLVVIQCKFYSQPVGYSAVQEAYTARALYSAASSIVCSNARFTRQARRTAARLGVRLVHHAALVETLSNLAAASTATRQTAPAAASTST